ncbi:hypothetical protein NQ318_009525 [Aromia moschata]|uniref:DDE-1 domain-containing protein n=1 Tax=Aromia moschata TaxID=1265417 RepID=A0AAV8XEE9_9CUCU|nr:hypothetical protein NQ318_009525 [Aromia moschata]
MEYKFEPRMIYNVDDSGVTTVQETERIIAPKRQKRIGSVTSWERTWELAKEHHVIMLTIPPHSSHRLQSLDVAFYCPIKEQQIVQHVHKIKQFDKKYTVREIVGLF